MGVIGLSVMDPRAYSSDGSTAAKYRRSRLPVVFWSRRPIIDNTITAMLGQRSEAAAAYDCFAAVYDRFNAQNDYEIWLGQVLLPELEKNGLLVAIDGAGEQRALDIGCGTGRAIPPLVARGWQVDGCDVSPRMLEVAAAKYPWMSADSFRVADVRELPSYNQGETSTPGPFQLILALNDVVNYLTDDGDLERAFEGMKRNLAAHGLICFDANTLALFAGAWTAGGDGEISRRGGTWLGLTEHAEPGGQFAAALGGMGVETHIHRERHWPRERVEEALKAAGLRVIAVLGQQEDGKKIWLEEPPDEMHHAKTIYLGGHRD